MTKDRPANPINRFKITLLEWLFSISQTAIYPPSQAAEKKELELNFKHQTSEWRSMFAYNLFQGPRDIRIAKIEAMLEQL
jgi:hypothetical protein